MQFFSLYFIIGNYIKEEISQISNLTFHIRQKKRRANQTQSKQAEDNDWKFMERFIKEKNCTKIARRYKKAFLSDQCKEIEERNRMGKTRYLFKIIRVTKGTFHAKMGSTKNRNRRELTEAEDIKKWQKYTEEQYKKDLHDPDNHNGVITHLELDILECEVKWAL